MSTPVFEVVLHTDRIPGYHLDKDYLGKGGVRVYGPVPLYLTRSSVSV